MQTKAQKNYFVFFVEKSNIHIYLKKGIKYVGNLLFHTIHCKPSSNYTCSRQFTWSLQAVLMSLFLPINGRISCSTLADLQ